MSDMTDPSGQMPRRPRVSDGGAPISGALAIILALVAVVAGYLILNSISDGGEKEADFPATGGTSVENPAGSSDSTMPGDGSSTTSTTSTTVPQIVTAGASVIVANANSVSGSAAQMSRALETGPGYTVVTPVNASPSVGTLDASKILYVTTNPAAETVADSLARSLGGTPTVEPLEGEAPVAGGDTAGADVILLLGNDLAGKSLEEINPTPDPATQGTSPAVAATTTTTGG